MPIKKVLVSVRREMCSDRVSIDLVYVFKKAKNVTSDVRYVQLNCIVHYPFAQTQVA